MLELKDITKDYKTTSDTVHALRGISVAFRDSELVAVLGHSGCGKTTLLNIIGGLDRYTSGDLIINGRSTKQYKDRDWDTYRNHSIGFIFQSYNLIPHQSVLSNVELALTLSGVSKTERRKRAKEALEKVGLGDQLHKRPNQMSGGQMQRVAIARALVNDPDILLADEPTGALDSETSIQIMDLVKEIAKDRLVIMVTHNPDLAHDYSTRIVKLVDGKIVSDTDPFDPAAAISEEKPEADSAERIEKSSKKSSMSFLTALSLSRNNLLTKKGRTFLTAFAGSIGIIGIALIMSLSNGVQEYINDVEHTTLASYPVTIQGETMDYSALMESMMGIREDDHSDRDPNKIYTNDISTEMIKTMLSNIQTNNLVEFKEYLESDPDNISESINEIQYSYTPCLNIYGYDVVGKLIRVNPSSAMESMLGDFANTFDQMSNTYSGLFGSGGGNPYDVWTELLKPETVKRQYEVLAGRLPESYDEVVLMVNKNNEMSDVTLYTLGLRDQTELKDMWALLMSGDTIDLDTGDLAFDYDELLKMRFRMLIPSDFYKANDHGGYDDMRGDEEYMKAIYDEKGVELKVVGIVRPDGDSLINSANSGGIGYTHELTEYMIEANKNGELAKKQMEDPDTDIFTGVAFAADDKEPQKPMTQEEAMTKLLEFMTQEQIGTIAQTVIQSLTPEQQAEIMQLPIEAQFAKMAEYAEPAKLTGALMSVITPEQMQKLQEMTKAPEKTEATYSGNLDLLGVADLDKPSAISIYANDFDSKERLAAFIEKYNDQKAAEGKQEDIINYTDYVGMIISSVSTIIDAISYILIAFVAISLVVSSIMIGIITYISVLERTKEIGILRAMGASKGNISNVFNAETLIVGLAAGIFGIGVTLLLNIPINIIIEHLTGIGGMSKLPPIAGVGLVIISMLLTLIAGLFPARVASKKDPVEALRTE